MHQMISRDFTETGKYNFYVIEEKLMPSMPAIAFQVYSNIGMKLYPTIYRVGLNFRKEVHIWKSLIISLI